MTNRGAIRVEERYQKNKQLIHDYFKDKINEGNKDLEEIFRKKSGAFPMDVIFKLIIGPDITDKLTKQLDLISDCVIEDLTNPGHLDEIIERNFKKYLRYDSTHVNLRKKHPVYETDALPIFRELMRRRMKHNRPLIKAIEGETYEEISHLMIPKKEDSISDYKEEREMNEKLMDLIRKNRPIINVAGIIRADIIDALFTVHDYIQEAWLRAIDELYG